MELYILITDLAIFLGLMGIVWLFERQRRDRCERFREITQIVHESVRQIIRSLDALSADARKAEEWQVQEIGGRLEALHKKIAELIATTESESHSISQNHSETILDLQKEVQRVGDRVKSLQESLEESIKFDKP